MTESASQAAALRVSIALAYVCDHLQELSAVLGDDGGDPEAPLARLLSTLRASEAPPAQIERGLPDITALLNSVHAALQAAGDVWGVYGAAPGRSGDTEGGMEALEIVYRCPLQKCAGRPGGQVAELRPVCAVSQQELLRERLP